MSLRGKTVLTAGLRTLALGYLVKLALGVIYPGALPEWGSLLYSATFLVFMVNLAVFTAWNAITTVRQVTGAYGCEECREGLPVLYGAPRRPSGLTAARTRITMSGGQVKYIAPSSGTFAPWIPSGDDLENLELALGESRRRRQVEAELRRQRQLLARRPSEREAGSSPAHTDNRM